MVSAAAERCRCIAGQRTDPMEPPANMRCSPMGGAAITPVIPACGASCRARWAAWAASVDPSSPTMTDRYPFCEGFRTTRTGRSAFLASLSMVAPKASWPSVCSPVAPATIKRTFTSRAARISSTKGSRNAPGRQLVEQRSPSGDEPVPSPRRRALPRAPCKPQANRRSHSSGPGPEPTRSATLASDRLLTGCSWLH